MSTMNATLFGGTSPLAFFQALGQRTGRFAKGGLADTIPAMLSKGEYVVNSKATSDNMGLLKAINDGSIRGFNKGGFVSYLAGGSDGSVNRTSSGLLGGISSAIGLDSGSQSALDSFSGATGKFLSGLNKTAPILASLGSVFGTFSSTVQTLNKAFNSFSGSLTHNINIGGSVNVDITGATGLITAEMKEGLQKFGTSMAQAEVRNLVQKMADSGMFGEGANFLLKDLP